jgi:methyl-accepting chemotaxis protein
MSSSSRILEVLFWPAIQLLNRLRYAWKFILIGVILLAPLLFLLRLQVRVTTEQSEFNNKERYGIVYINATKEMLHAIQRHRVYAVAVAAGDASFKPSVSKSTSDVDAQIPVIDKVDKDLTSELQTAEKWGQVKAAWGRLKASTATSTAEVDAAHDEVTGLLVSLILDDAGNNSNLILDPDLDSYWLMDLWVIKMPALGQSISSIATTSMKEAAEGEARTDKALDLAGQLKIMNSTASDMVNVDMKTAIKESTNPKFGQSPTLVRNLDAPSKAYLEQLTGFSDNITAQVVKPSAAVGKGPVAIQVRAITDLSIRALKANYDLYEKIGPELDWLCKKRVDNYNFQRLSGLVAAGFAGLLLTYIFVGFFLQVRKSTIALGEATTRMIAGTTERFMTDARDELGGIVGAYNQINDALVASRTLQERVARENQDLQDNILDLLRVVADASDGDLTVRAKVTEGALGNVADAFNALLESLQNLVGQIKEQFQKTNDAVGEISDSSSQMARGATEQASEIAAASQLIDKLSNDVMRVTSTAKSAAEAATKTEVSAAEGAKSVQDVINGMGTLRSNVQAGAKKMKNLGDRSMEITSIVATIARISEQTNMLALNAAIEAARAGEHGRGFSVVAEEVRKLAERTAGATQEIEKLVKAIQQETNETISAIEQQTQFVEQESALVAQAGQSLGNIRSMSTESASLVVDITTVAKKQAEGTTTVVKTMEQILAISSATQEGAQNAMATIENLRALSSQLTDSISRFRLS